MKFKIFGTKIYISFLFSAIITLMLYFDKTTLFLPCLIATLLHEIGHLFAMWLYECAPKEINLIPTSVQIVRVFSKKPYGETFIAFFGPLVNIVFFAVFYINYLCFKDEKIIKFALINLIIAIFNLLPVKCLDGGDIIFNIIADKKDIYSAEKTVNILTFISATILFILGVFLLLKGNINITIFIMALYLLLSVIIK